MAARLRKLQAVREWSLTITFDKRGTGLSDRMTNAATLEERIEQVDAEIDRMVCQLYGLTEEEIALVEGIEPLRR